MTTISLSPDYAAAVDAARTQLSGSGTWFDAHQMVAIVSRADARSRQRSSAPWNHDLPAGDDLPAAAVTVIDKIAGDPGSVDADWAREQIDDLGAGPYVEVVGTVAVAVAMRILADSAGTDVEPVVPGADPGEPSHETPDGLGDIGAHVPMLDPFPFANVARALSSVPSANATFYTLVRPLYSAAGFEHLVWNTPLSRPQVELVASRVAAMNECFY